MSKLSDIIEEFIKEMFEANDLSTVEIRRNLLAQQFDCSPSQINYVLTTRFNNDKGYMVESRRGGGGYIKIFRINISKDDQLENILSKSIGESITQSKAFDLIDIFREKGIISAREHNIMKRAVSDRAFSKIYHEDRNKLRSDILKEMMMTLMMDN